MAAADSDERRLRALRQFEVLDTGPEACFDRLTELAAEIFDAPIALVSLIDADRQWFKSRFGLEATETPRSWAFCDHAIQLEPNSTFVVEDPVRDPRFAENPLVTGDPNIRFYSGAVLTDRDGVNLGTLCVIDNKVREAPTERELKRLRVLADIVVDELELRKAAKSLAVKENLLDLAEQMCRVGHWRAFPESQQVEWSDELYRIYGVERQSYPPVWGASRDFYSEADAGKLENLFRRAVKYGECLDYEVTIRRGDGEERIITGKTDIQKDESGRVSVIVGAIQDVTEFRAATRAAEAAAEAKAEFLANMSHELRTPLTSIIGFAELASNQAGITAETGGYLKRVRSASQALLATVNDILDFSKLEAGQIILAPEPTDVAELCRETLDLLTPQAAPKGLSLNLETEGSVGGHSLLDANRVRQILLNLVGNAVKFTAAGGVRVVLSRDGDCLRFDVHDSGPGISPADQQRLFQRFSQIDGAISSGGPGTGLGLAICKGLVEAMGGEIGVTSTMGVGACFWMKVPAPAVEPRAACFDDTARPPPVNLDGLKLLVADDHETNRELVRLIFTGLGASVTLVENGQDAVIAARNETFDAILLDVRMPVMGGVEACRRIREAGGENGEAAIFAFTADADLEQPGMIGGQGFDGLISKPVNPAAMVTAILQGLTQQETDAVPARTTR